MLAPEWLSNIPDSEVGLYIIDMCQKIDWKMYIIIKRILLSGVCYLMAIEKSRDLKKLKLKLKYGG